MIRDYVVLKTGNAKIYETLFMSKDLPVDKATEIAQR